MGLKKTRDQADKRADKMKRSKDKKKKKKKRGGVSLNKKTLQSLLGRICSSHTH